MTLEITRRVLVIACRGWALFLICWWALGHSWLFLVMAAGLLLQASDFNNPWRNIVGIAMVWPAAILELAT